MCTRMLLGSPPGGGSARERERVDGGCAGRVLPSVRGVGKLRPSRARRGPAALAPSADAAVVLTRWAWDRADRRGGSGPRGATSSGGIRRPCLPRCVAQCASAPALFPSRARCRRMPLSVRPLSACVAAAAAGQGPRPHADLEAARCPLRLRIFGSGSSLTGPSRRHVRA